jgi:hypothetical protein
MIPLLPYWKFIIHTPLSQQEALTRLSSEVSSAQRRFFFSWDSSSQEFRGIVSNNDFCIERIIHYKNSFLPTIYGHFLPTKTGLQIRIVMSLHPITLIIGIVLCLCALPFLVSFVYRFIAIGHFDEALKTPFQVMAFLYLLFTGGFAFEAVKARRLLNRIFESNPPTSALPGA